MDIKTIRSIIKKREATNDEWQYGVERCWEELSDALTSDYAAARQFLLVDATADEIAWVSEVFQEIIEKTQSERYVDLLREAVSRFPAEGEMRRVKNHLEDDIAMYYQGRC